MLQLLKVHIYFLLLYINFLTNFVDSLSIDAFLEESPMKILESDDFVNDIDVMFSVALGVSN